MRRQGNITLLLAASFNLSQFLEPGADPEVDKWFE